MWHLIRLINKKDKDRAEQSLKDSGVSFFPISSLLEQHHSQPAIVALLVHSCGLSYLVEGGNTSKDDIGSFLNIHKDLFQRVRCRTGNPGHVQMTQQEFDQFILTLQIPEKYKVVWSEQLPDEGNLKDIQIPYGPLRGLKGKYLNIKTPSGKRFYTSVLSLFHIEVRIPIKDVRRNKAEVNMEISYLTEQRTPHWYLLTSNRKEYIERLMGETLNEWNPTEEMAPIVTTLNNPDNGQALQTTRYMYQAIYYRPDKDGGQEAINLMPNYYFFRTNRYDLETFRGNNFDSHIYVMRRNDGMPVCIPEIQMNMFIRFLKERSEATEVLYEDYQKGDVAHIAMGVESNNEIEGVVEIVTKKHYILISENGFKINVRKGKRKKE